MEGANYHNAIDPLCEELNCPLFTEALEFALENAPQGLIPIFLQCGEKPGLNLLRKPRHEIIAAFKLPEFTHRNNFKTSSKGIRVGDRLNCPIEMQEKMQKQSTPNPSSA